jgi:hypothetical protein
MLDCLSRKMKEVADASSGCQVVIYIRDLGGWYHHVGAVSDRPGVALYEQFVLQGAHHGLPVIRAFQLRCPYGATTG